MPDVTRNFTFTQSTRFCALQLKIVSLSLISHCVVHGNFSKYNLRNIQLSISKKTNAKIKTCSYYYDFKKVANVWRDFSKCMKFISYFSFHLQFFRASSRCTKCIQGHLSPCRHCAFAWMCLQMQLSFIRPFVGFHADSLFRFFSAVPFGYSFIL